jgi:uncharacterized protein (DUF1778 family)
VAGAAEAIGAESLSGRESRVEIVDSRVYVSGIEHDQRTGNLAMSSSLFSGRLSDAERALLEAAASQAGTNISDFVRRRAVEAAEIDVLDKRIVTIPAMDWKRFEAWASQPAREIAGLEDLTCKSPTWRR